MRALILKAGFLIATIFLLLSIPIWILNLLGAVVSGVWLAFLGVWDKIFFGVWLIIAGPFLCAIALALVMSIPVFLGAALYEKGGILKILAFPFLMIGLIMMFGIVTIWGLMSFGLLTANAVLKADYDVILPLTIWSYGVACGPWDFLAAKELLAGQVHNYYSGIAIISLHIASACMIPMVGFSLVDLETAIITYLGIMGFGLLSGIVISFFDHPLTYSD